MCSFRCRQDAREINGRVLKAVEKLTTTQRVTDCIRLKGPFGMLSLEYFRTSQLEAGLPLDTVYMENNTRDQTCPAYRNDDGTQELCRQLLALPYLPHEDIQAVFERLEQKATTDKLEELVAYMRRQWIEETSGNHLHGVSSDNLSAPTTISRAGTRALNRHARRGNLTFNLLIRLL
ncbi:hypothetical protein BSL78_06527 [Apostichopus japonicus]|uniref:Uncharacterized protein n=1 Tax=Stichopus japonicus TaxID=307972 RepID=A0A2G8L8G8_STIJA|nr:hypothetical protein BSL78_06527 [Apostichopus japonicus]